MQRFVSFFFIGKEALFIITSAKNCVQLAKCILTTYRSIKSWVRVFQFGHISVYIDLHDTHALLISECDDQ